VATTFEGMKSIEMAEGKESKDFWAAIGTKKPYLDSAFHKTYNQKVRLLSLSTKTGDFKALEIAKYLT
jgi:hypothetical protein